ncbi:spore germination protein GerW family protein [Adhaeribacter rhizoryzae]|uniref:Sporulation protein n=1 Tax=Adhaeribacter rhizoryzae TaxID=2607907 RepID=A0A5M6CXJ8_9BACT|nr:spore germination protein GerW family protein [Adhaeribacter rhizoryzae]KAA5539948.1 hypothetical protein F0145_23445 [Adhaeribacter rhizoryzae]
METTQIKQLISSLTETFSQNSTIKKVYGDPKETQGKTIIPVAKVSFGFGGGFGGGGIKGQENADTPEPETNKAKGQGGGMGGGLLAKPLGLLEITPEYTRFVRFDISRYLVIGGVLGLMVGLISKRNRRKHQYPAL